MEVELGEAKERPDNEGVEVRVGRAGVGDSVSIKEGVFVAVGAKWVPVPPAEATGDHEY